MSAYDNLIGRVSDSISFTRIGWIVFRNADTRSI